jgi:hypothetical protein
MALLFLMIFVGYASGSTNADFIRIISVFPNSNLTEGIEQQFTVTVEYVLSSREQAVLYIGFNYLQQKWYHLVYATPSRANRGLVVGKGRGIHTFNVTAKPKNWHSSPNFGVYANLSPYPHGENWYPLVIDEKELSF